MRDGEKQCLKDRTVVVGAGSAGLSAAQSLQLGGDEDVTVAEARLRCVGQVFTIPGVGFRAHDFLVAVKMKHNIAPQVSYCIHLCEASCVASCKSLQNPNFISRV